MNWILNALFPARCLHCREEIEGDILLCTPCQELFNSPIDPTTRCPRCFSEERGACCKAGELPFTSMGAVFDYVGPAKTLVETFKKHQKRELAKTFAAYMVIQHERLGWPKPDLVTSIPLSFGRTLLRGFNQAELLAKEFAKFLNVPYVKTLRKIDGEFAQSSLPLNLRKKGQKSSFFPKKGVDLSDRTVFLIDDITVTGATLLSAGETLLKMHPFRLYSFCLCKF